MTGRITNVAVTRNKYLSVNKLFFSSDVTSLDHGSETKMEMEKNRKNRNGQYFVENKNAMKVSSMP